MSYSDLTSEISRLLLALALGGIISVTYRLTSRELVPSQGYMHTVVVTCIIAYLAVRVTERLETAFIAVGILSLLRFRTVIRDTSEFTFVFLALASGVGLGTNRLMLTALGTVFCATTAYCLFQTNFGSPSAKPFRLKIVAPAAAVFEIEEYIRRSSIKAELLGANGVKSGIGTYHFDLLLESHVSADEFIKNLAVVGEISEISLMLLRRESGLKDARE